MITKSCVLILKNTRQPIMAQVQPISQKTSLCESIINLSENILAAVLVDEEGRVKEMKICDDSPFSNLSPARRAVLFDDLVLRQIMRREFDIDGGKEEYTLTKRNRMILISFPINGSVLIVATQPFVETYHICKKILKTLAVRKIN